MTLVVPTPRPADDDLDGQLRAFYRDQMPNPWPAWKAPPITSRPPARPAPRPLWRSRLGDFGLPAKN